MRTKGIQFEETAHSQTVDSNGEVKEQTSKSTTKIRVEQEPDFVKLYIKDICKLNDIPTTGNNILNELLKYMGYDNLVLLPSGVKKKITEDLDLGKSTLDNTLGKLVKKDILKREGVGMYKLNPYLFGRGSWKDIKGIRATWTYNENGRVISDIAVEREEELENLDS